MTCNHTIYRGSLTCTRTDAHDPAADGGHVYQAAWAADAHDASEAVET